MDTQSFIAAVLFFQLLIVIHEFGHYWFAKRFGMRVSRFSVGFGPKLFGFRREGTEFVLSAVPFGGYVQIDGMSAADEIDPKDPAAYPNKPMWQRFVVVVMGPIANLVLAFFCFFLVLTSGYDRPAPDTSKIGAVRAGTAAERAGLLAGDDIRSIANRPIARFDDIPAAVQESSGAIPVVFVRNGVEQTVIVDPDVQVKSSFIKQLFRLDQKTARMLGVQPPSEHVDGVGLGAAVVGGVSRTLGETQRILSAFATLVTGKAKGRLTGLPGIVKLLGEAVGHGLSSALSLMAILSINLFLFNLFPIPALDGGRLIFLLVEGIRRKPVDAKVEGYVHGVGFIMLMGLIVFVSVRDLIV